jgi:hypothetical protein
MKKAKPATGVEHPAEDPKRSRSYFNDTGLDYDETGEVKCINCGQSFEGTRLVWGGQTSIDFPVLCKPCSSSYPSAPKTKPGELTPYTLLRKEGPEEMRSIPNNWFVPADGNDFQDEFVHRIAGVARLAQWGNLTAATLLYNVATVATLHLQNVARKRPTLLKKFSTKADTWPTLIGTLNKKGKCRNSTFNQWLSDTLEIGRESLWRGKWKASSPATQCALQMITWLFNNRTLLKLPTLNKKTQLQWFSAGWAALCQACGGHPETDEYLRKIGNHRATHNSGTNKAATTEANIRDGIKKQIRQSFISLCKNFATSPDKGPE